MLAKIFKPAPSAMQSGKAASKEWMIEFDGSAARFVDPLMGWISSTDTTSQVRIAFDTREEAIEFAQRQGFAFQVTEPRESKRLVKSYAENFSFGRRRPWTH